MITIVMIIAVSMTICSAAHIGEEEQRQIEAAVAASLADSDAAAELLAKERRIEELMKMNDQRNEEEAAARQRREEEIRIVQQKLQQEGEQQQREDDAEFEAALKASMYDEKEIRINNLTKRIDERNVEIKAYQRAGVSDDPWIDALKTKNADDTKELMKLLV